MIKAEILDLVFGGVDLLVGVLELGLDHEGRGVSIPTGRGMVRASIATLGLDVGDIAVGGDDLLDEGSEALVDVVDNDTHRLLLTSIKSSLNVARHVLLEHGLDVARLLLVL